MKLHKILQCKDDSILNNIKVTIKKTKLKVYNKKTFLNKSTESEKSYEVLTELNTKAINEINKDEFISSSLDYVEVIEKEANKDTKYFESFKSLNNLNDINQKKGVYIKNQLTSSSTNIQEDYTYYHSVNIFEPSIFKSFSKIHKDSLFLQTKELMFLSSICYKTLGK